MNVTTNSVLITGIINPCNVRTGQLKKENLVLKRTCITFRKTAKKKEQSRVRGEVGDR